MIDVSTAEEFKELHIPGALNYDVLNVDFVHKLDVLDRARSYFIYCRNGKRSETAMRLMKEMGFKRVYALMTGLQSWSGTLARSY